MNGEESFFFEPILYERAERLRRGQEWCYELSSTDFAQSAASPIAKHSFWSRRRTELAAFREKELDSCPYGRCIDLFSLPAFHISSKVEMVFFGGALRNPSHRVCK
jgi:hypothetical protein